MEHGLKTGMEFPLQRAGVTGKNIGAAFAVYPAPGYGLP
jgi:hypothetical protein